MAERAADTVLITSRSFSSGRVDVEGRLLAAGLNVRRAGAQHRVDELAEVLPDAVAWIAGTGPITASHLALGRRLRVIARYGVGVDAVDLSVAARANVIVTNTPGANSASVAEHTIALLLAAVRGVPAGDERVRRGDWSTIQGRLIAGALAGVVGFGHIGRETAWRLAALGCRVIIHDPYVPEAVVNETGARSVTLAELATTAELVCLHAPSGPIMVDSRWVDDAPVGQVIVNAARAELVDEQAIADGLNSGRVFAYAADTLTAEKGVAASPIFDRASSAHVTVTPHLGGQTIESVDRMGEMAVDAVLDVLHGRTPRHIVGGSAEHA